MKKLIVVSIMIMSFISISCNKNLKTIVEMKTNFGTITLELYNNKAPKTVENFIKYAKAKRYDGTIFHRVISSFMIQGGGFTPDMTKTKSFAPIKNEADNGLTNDRGTIAMARTNDINSATNQFFINVKDNISLNHGFRGQFGYCVFGKVIAGMKVVDQIREVDTEIRDHYRDVPADDVVIQSIIIVKTISK